MLGTGVGWNSLLGAPVTAAWASAGLAAGLFALGAWLSSRFDRSADFVDQLFETDCVGLVLLDEKGSVLRLNSKAQAILGLPRERGIPEECEALLAHSLARSRNPPPPPIDGVIQAVSPQIFPEFACGEIPLQIKGRRFSIVVLSDIRTTVWALQKESERLRAQIAADLLSQIAHEVRNPVAAISGSAQLLGKLYAQPEHGDSRPEYRFRKEMDELCRSIIEESSRLESVIAHWLAYPRAPENSPEKAGLSSKSSFHEDSTPSAARKSAARH